MRSSSVAVLALSTLAAYGLRVSDDDVDLHAVHTHEAAEPEVKVGADALTESSDEASEESHDANDWVEHHTYVHDSRRRNVVVVVHDRRRRTSVTHVFYDSMTQTASGAEQGTENVAEKPKDDKKKKRKKEEEKEEDDDEDSLAEKPKDDKKKKKKKKEEEEEEEDDEDSLAEKPKDDKKKKKKKKEEEEEDDEDSLAG